MTETEGVGPIPEFRVEYFKDKKGKWRFRIVAVNNEVVAQSQGYKHKRDAVDIAKRIIKEQ